MMSFLRVIKDLNHELNKLEKNLMSLFITQQKRNLSTYKEIIIMMEVTSSD